MDKNIFKKDRNIIIFEKGKRKRLSGKLLCRYCGKESLFDFRVPKNNISHYSNISFCGDICYNTYFEKKIQVLFGQSFTNNFTPNLSNIIFEQMNKFKDKKENSKKRKYNDDNDIPSTGRKKRRIDKRKSLPSNELSSRKSDEKNKSSKSDQDDKSDEKTICYEPKKKKYNNIKSNDNTSVSID